MALGESMFGVKSFDAAAHARSEGAPGGGLRGMAVGGIDAFHGGEGWGAGEMRGYEGVVVVVVWSWLKGGLGCWRRGWWWEGGVRSLRRGSWSRGGSRCSVSRSARWKCCRRHDSCEVDDK